MGGFSSSSLISRLVMADDNSPRDRNKVRGVLDVQSTIVDFDKWEEEELISEEHPDATRSRDEESGSTRE